MCLDKCLKTPVWQEVSTGDFVNGRKTDSILMRATLSSWVITAKVIELLKSLLDTWIFFRLFLTTLTADDKNSFISKDKWIQTIQMNLSQKSKIFSKNFTEFFESALNF